ncbi:hypothetical protein [Plantibacter sp. ME-Dv--P-095]|nr:hypothetical protein [Plantibacter sp. ME-Dv--P-095]
MSHVHHAHPVVITASTYFPVVITASTYFPVLALGPLAEGLS